MTEHIIQELNDIPLPAENIDEKIQDLVRALNGLGLKTMESCEGHLDRLHTLPLPRVRVWPPFPFMYKDVADVGLLFERLKIGIEEYNLLSEVKWVHERDSIRPFAMASNEQELAVLQKSASQLALFLFDRYIKQS